MLSDTSKYPHRDSCSAPSACGAASAAEEASKFGKRRPLTVGHAFAGMGGMALSAGHPQAGHSNCVAAGGRLYWRGKSRAGRLGRPCVSQEIRELIRKMSTANPLWGAPRLHVEWLKLGIQISQATVAKYMVRNESHLHKRGALFLKITVNS